MNPHLLIVALGLFYILVFGGLALLRREGLSTQFAVEALIITGLVVLIAALLNTVVDPILFLVFIYLLTMRNRLMVDIANMLSNRGRQKNAMSVLQWALRLFPDRSAKLVIMVNMGIVQLRRKNPASAISLFQDVLAVGEQGGLGIKYEAACRYNLGVALMQQGEEAEAARQFNEVRIIYPNSIFSKAAEAKIDQRQHKRNVAPQDEDEKQTPP
jgi:tetratricopeptide (TPR) repeat protein